MICPQFIYCRYKMIPSPCLLATCFCLLHFIISSLCLCEIQSLSICTKVDKAMPGRTWLWRSQTGTCSACLGIICYPFTILTWATYTTVWAPVMKWELHLPASEKIQQLDWSLTVSKHEVYQVYVQYACHVWCMYAYSHSVYIIYILTHAHQVISLWVLLHLLVSTFVLLIPFQTRGAYPYTTTSRQTS